MTTPSSSHSRGPQHQATAGDHGESHGVGHIVPVRLLVAVGVVLLVLTVVTVVAASFDFGRANVPIALAIAGVKASLVVLFFMHLRWDRPFNSFVFVVSIAFVLMFIGFALTDTSAYRADVLQTDGTMVQQKLTEITSQQ